MGLQFLTSDRLSIEKVSVSAQQPKKKDGSPAKKEFSARGLGKSSTYGDKYFGNCDSGQCGRM